MRDGLLHIGLSEDMAEWLISEVKEIPRAVHDLREWRKRYGKVQETLYSHINEAYSPVRVTGMAEKMGLKPGLALDLTTKDEHGNPWDFNVEAMRIKAKKIVKNKAALLLMVSPMCSAFSRLQHFNTSKLSDDKKRQLWEDGMRHLAFPMELCKFQRNNGLYFLFEHPAGASSWSTNCVQRILRYPDVYHGDMCTFDMSQVSQGTEWLIKKPIRFMTNSQEIGKSLAIKCKGNHRHLELTGGGRTRRAEVYPDKLCKAIVKGLISQMAVDKRHFGSFAEEPSINEIPWENEDECVSAIGLTRTNSEWPWSRRDYQTNRLKLPDSEGPMWSTCIRRITQDLDTIKIIENRKNRGYTRQRAKHIYSKGNQETSAPPLCMMPTSISALRNENVVNVITQIWLKIPSVCQCCRSLGKLRPHVPMTANAVYSEDNDHVEEAWDDVPGAKLDISKVKEARNEEMSQFWKHEV